MKFGSLGNFKWDTLEKHAYVKNLVDEDPEIGFKQ